MYYNDGINDGVMFEHREPDQTCGRPFLQELHCLLTITFPTMSRVGNGSLPGLAVVPPNGKGSAKSPLHKVGVWLVYVYTLLKIVDFNISFYFFDF